jgi:YgiT-type zinc finger domain-containing protein
VPQLTLTRIRELVRSLEYVVTIHAAEELEDDNLTSETVTRARSRASSAAARSPAVKPKRSSSSVRLAGSSSSRSTPSSQLCTCCGRAGIQLRKVTRSFGTGKALLVIEGIPMWSCPHCGESYFTAQTMHEVERIKALRKSVAIERPVSVAEF